MEIPAGRRCFGDIDEVYRAYHDTEWGVPRHDDRMLFEGLILSGMQAGLSWHIILKKRPEFRRAFADFDPQRVARFTGRDVQRLLKNAGIVRNKLKITAAIQNAKCFLQVQREFRSFDAFVWPFVGGKPLVNCPRTLRDVPARTAESDALSQELIRRGFKFVGSTICYAYMQALGLVNDHLVTCPVKHGE